MLVVHVVSEVAEVGVFLLFLVADECLLRALELLLLLLRLLPLLLLAPASSLDDHLLPTLLVLNELFGELRRLFIPFAHLN